MDYMISTTHGSTAAHGNQHHGRFTASVRTNNGVEGWHHRLNRKAQKPNLQMYILIVLLHRAKEARLLPTQLKMVTEGKLRRYQRKKTKELQHRIFALWDKYSEEEVTVNQCITEEVRPVWYQIQRQSLYHL